MMSVSDSFENRAFALQKQVGSSFRSLNFQENRAHSHQFVLAAELENFVSFTMPDFRQCHRSITRTKHGVFKEGARFSHSRKTDGINHISQSHRWRICAFDAYDTFAIEHIHSPV